MHTHDSEVLVKDMKRNKFTVGRAECSLVRHKVLVSPSVLST